MRLRWLLVLAAAAALAPAAPRDKPSLPRWHISGMFTEACSCAPPCPCNFGLASSPHDFCYTLFSYSIKSGEYDGVPLGGLAFTCAKGQAGFVWYIDRRATPAQAAALRVIAARIVPIRHGDRDSGGQYAKAVLRAAITQEVTERGSRVRIEGAGGFDNTFLLGMDGKTPIVVLNNTNFNLKRSLKGRTGAFRYQDRFGNNIEFKGTNTNTGEFEYDQDTQKFFE
jgi:hypothetical protein